MTDVVMCLVRQIILDDGCTLTVAILPDDFTQHSCVVRVERVCIDEETE